MLLGFYDFSIKTVVVVAVRRSTNQSVLQARHRPGQPETVGMPAVRCRWRLISSRCRAISSPSSPAEYRLVTKLFQL